MHELSIAQALVKQIEAAATEAGGGDVTSACIVVGGLSGVDSEALRMVFPIASEGTPIANTQLEIKEDPAIIACNTCGERSTPGFPLPICSACDSVDVTIEGGRHLMLESIQLSSNQKAS
jgi:hydrogenase nickel incorporation protein HypA/HybF